MARNHRPDDSLDLLLDTMCNAFGGIIMIAILVTLLAKDPKTTASSSAAPVQNPGMTPLQQQIQNATATKASLINEIQKAGPVGQLLIQRDGLAAQVAGAEKALETAEMASDRPSPPGTVKDPVAALQGQLALLRKKEQQLQELLVNLGEQSKDKQAKQSIVFKPPPPAQQTQKAPFSLIFRHDRMYQVEVSVRGTFENNRETIRWNGNEAIPIKEKGIDPAKDKAAALALIRSLPAIGRTLSGRELYVASYVYADSFRAYLLFKQLFLTENVGVSHGWQPIPHMDNLKFGAFGSQAPVQGN